MKRKVTYPAAVLMALAPKTTVMGFQVLLDAAPPKAGEAQPNPKWIHIANAGTYDGYPGGGVEITLATFEQIVKNFHDDPRYKMGGSGVGESKVVPFDFGHVSEMDPRIGNPASNEAAPAWVMDCAIRKGSDGRAQLWGLTLLGDKVKTMIESGEITFVSIAYHPNAIHPVSGQEIGALMTSVAFTNKPFIRDLTPLAASQVAADLHSNPDFAKLVAAELRKDSTTMIDIKRLAKIFGLNAAAEGAEEAILAMAAECFGAKKSVEDIFKALGFDNLADLVKEIPNIAKAKEKLSQVTKDLDVALKDLAGFQSLEAEAEVAASMRVHEIPEKCKGVMLKAFKADKEGFRKDYPLPEKDRAHLLSTFAAGGGGQQVKTPKVGADLEIENRENGTGEKIDLRAFTGNVTQQCIAYLKSKDASFEKLSWADQCTRAGTFRQKNAANLILA